MADFDLPWLSVQSGKIGVEDVTLIRVSFAGEMGWEIHAERHSLPDIYEKALENGAKPFGMFALNSLRIEKGYKSWKGDLSSDYSVLETGLERFIDFGKEIAFPGRSAILIEQQAGVKKNSVSLILDESDCDAPYMATLWKDGQIVGEVTSGAWGYRVGKSIALAMIKNEFSVSNTEVEVDIFGKRVRAVVQSDRVLWDKKNKRMMA